MLQSLRARLAFLFAGTLVLATVIAAVVVVSLYQSYNRDQTVSSCETRWRGSQAYYQNAVRQVAIPAQVRGPQAITPATFETVTRGAGLLQRRRRSFPVRRLHTNAGGREHPPGQHPQRGRGRCTTFKPKGATRSTSASAPRSSQADQNVGEVVLGRPLADVNNAWKNIVGLVGVGLAVGLAVALILATYVARRITHPLRVIGSAADKVARGDLDVNVVGKRNSDDELGQLATRFQGMVDRLREVDELERNFLMRVTHELRTPLTAISGHVQAVTEGVVGPESSTSRSRP